MEMWVEGWALAFFLVVAFSLEAITVRTVSLNSWAIFVGLVSIWPIFWMYYDYETLGRPLYSVGMNHTWVADQLARSHASMAYRLALIPVVLMLTTFLPVFMAAFWGFCSALRRLRTRSVGSTLSAIVFALGCIQVIQVVTGGVMSFARYTLTVGTLLLIFSGDALLNVATATFKVGFLKLVAIAAGILAAYLGLLTVAGAIHSNVSEKLRSVGPVLRFPDHIDSVGNFLKKNLGPRDGVLIDNYNYEPNLIAASGGLSEIARNSVES
jgi:hypothetical protein